MNKIILSLVFLATSFANAQKTATLTVNTSGFKNNDGKVKVGLYNSEGTFLKKAYLGSTQNINDLKATIVFKNIPVGEYAISIFHDEDNDGKLKTGIFGIPKEDYAASNNAKGMMGPPKYKDAKFIVNKNETVEVVLNK